MASLTGSIWERLANLNLIDCLGLRSLLARREVTGCRVRKLLCLLANSSLQRKVSAHVRRSCPLLGPVSQTEQPTCPARLNVPPAHTQILQAPVGPKACPFPPVWPVPSPPPATPASIRVLPPLSGLVSISPHTVYLENLEPTEKLELSVVLSCCISSLAVSLCTCLF